MITGLVLYTSWFFQTHQTRFLVPVTPALALIAAYNARIEREYLLANAQRIAADVVPLMQPPPDANPENAQVAIADGSTRPWNW